MKLREGGHLLTIRTRLTLGNITILALYVLLLSLLLRHCAATELAKEMDREMIASVRPLTGRFSLTILSYLRQERERGIKLPVSDASVPGLSGEDGWLPLRAMDTRQRRLLSGEPVLPYDEAGYTRALRGERNYTTLVFNGNKTRILSVPLTSDGIVVGVLQAARSFDRVERQVTRLTGLLMMILPFAVVTAGATGWFVTARALKPVGNIAQAATRIEASDLSRRLPVSGSDEFAELAATFNAMLSRLERAFAQQRRFTTDASHELRTPLAMITGDVSLALSAERSITEYRQTLQNAAVAAERMHRIVQDLLEIARAEEGKAIVTLELLTLTPVLQQTIAQIKKQNPSGPAIRVHCPSGDDGEIVGDSHCLERLFINLFENAVRHTPTSGEITVTLSAEQQAVVVTVRDTGEGIAPEHLPHIFDSFYRADSSRTRNRGGTGLGLAICRSIVDAHQGNITIDSQPGNGTTVTVTFPRMQLTQQAF